MRIASIEEIITEFVERAHNAVWCNVATIDRHGRVQSRILHPIWHGAVGYIGTRRSSPKAAHLAHSTYVSLAYVADIVKPTYAECRATWVDEPMERAKVWELYESAPPPLGFDYGSLFTGPDDAAFGVIRVEPWRIKLQDSPAIFRTWQEPEA